MRILVERYKNGDERIRIEGPESEVRSSVGHLMQTIIKNSPKVSAEKGLSAFVAAIAYVGPDAPKEFDLEKFIDFVRTDTTFVNKFSFKELLSLEKTLQGIMWRNDNG